MLLGLPLCAGGHKLQREQEEDGSGWGQGPPPAEEAQARACVSDQAAALLSLGLLFYASTPWKRSVGRRSPGPAQPAAALQQHPKPQSESPELLHRMPHLSFLPVAIKL